MKIRHQTILLCLCFAFCALFFTHNSFGQPTSEQGGAMKLASPEFKNNQAIPMKFSCEEIDINPALTILDVPAQAKSLALIMDDPDAPNGTWVHWVVFDIPATVTNIKENSIPGKQGRNDFDRLNYGGPCPPIGEHRYFFKLYALDTLLNLPEGITKSKLEDAMKGHIIGEAQLVGLYKKMYQ